MAGRRSRACRASATSAAGSQSAMSLAQLSAWCRDRFGAARGLVRPGEPRRFDVPWIVLDAGLAASGRGAGRREPRIDAILEEIAAPRRGASRLAVAVLSRPECRAAAARSALSVVIPARDEEGCIASTVEHLHRELRLHSRPARDRRRRRRQHRRRRGTLLQRLASVDARAACRSGTTGRTGSAAP